MKRQLFIITGASRGLGFCLAEQLLAPQHELLCLSRHASAELAQIASQRGAALTQLAVDLAEPLPVALQLTQWLQERAADPPAGVSLINNAGVIPAVLPLHSSDAAELAHALRVGLEAPVVLSCSFLATTRNWSARRRVLNISSGLGRRPMASQAAYCAAKAGLDHFTRCMALDEARLPNGARVCSLAPGVIDTAMQLQLRSAVPTQFPDQARFAELKQLGQLSSPQEAASQVLAYLNRTDFGDQPVADVRN